MIPKNNEERDARQRYGKKQKFYTIRERISKNCKKFTEMIKPDRNIDMSLSVPTDDAYLEMEVANEKKIKRIREEITAKMLSIHGRVSQAMFMSGFEVYEFEDSAGVCATDKATAESLSKQEEFNDYKQAVMWRMDIIREKMSEKCMLLDDVLHWLKAVSLTERMADSDMDIAATLEVSGVFQFILNDFKKLDMLTRKLTKMAKILMEDVRLKFACVTKPIPLTVVDEAALLANNTKFLVAANTMETAFNSAIKWLEKPAHQLNVNSGLEQLKHFVNACGQRFQYSERLESRLNDLTAKLQDAVQENKKMSTECDSLKGLVSGFQRDIFELNDKIGALKVERKLQSHKLEEEEKDKKELIDRRKAADMRLQVSMINKNKAEAEVLELTREVKYLKALLEDEQQGKGKKVKPELAHLPDEKQTRPLASKRAFADVSELPSEPKALKKTYTDMMSHIKDLEDQVYKAKDCNLELMATLKDKDDLVEKMKAKTQKLEKIAAKATMDAKEAEVKQEEATKMAAIRESRSARSRMDNALRPTTQEGQDSPSVLILKETADAASATDQVSDKSELSPKLDHLTWESADETAEKSKKKRHSLRPGEKRGRSKSLFTHSSETLIDLGAQVKKQEKTKRKKKKDDPSKTRSGTGSGSTSDKGKSKSPSTPGVSIHSPDSDVYHPLTEDVSLSMGPADQDDGWLIGSTSSRTPSCMDEIDRSASYYEDTSKAKGIFDEFAFGQRTAERVFILQDEESYPFSPNSLYSKSGGLIGRIVMATDAEGRPIDPETLMKRYITTLSGRQLYPLSQVISTDVNELRLTKSRESAQVSKTTSDLRLKSDDRGHYWDMTGRLVDKYGCFVDEQGRYVDEDGALITEGAQLVDAKCRVMDGKGKLVFYRGHPFAMNKPPPALARAGSPRADARPESEQRFLEEMNRKRIDLVESAMRMADEMDSTYLAKRQVSPLSGQASLSLSPKSLTRSLLESSFARTQSPHASVHIPTARTATPSPQDHVPSLLKGSPVHVHTDVSIQKPTKERRHSTQAQPLPYESSKKRESLTHPLQFRSLILHHKKEILNKSSRLHQAGLKKSLTTSTAVEQSHWLVSRGQKHPTIVAGQEPSQQLLDDVQEFADEHAQKLSRQHQMSQEQHSPPQHIHHEIPIQQPVTVDQPQEILDQQSLPAGPPQRILTPQALPPGPPQQILTPQALSASPPQQILTQQALPAGPPQQILTQQPLSASPPQQILTQQPLPASPPQQILTQQALPPGPSQQILTQQALPAGPPQQILTQQALPPGPPQQILTQQALSAGPSQQILTQQALPAGPPQQILTQQALPAGPPQQILTQQPLPPGPPQQILTQQALPPGPSQQILTQPALPTHPSQHILTQPSLPASPSQILAQQVLPAYSAQQILTEQPRLPQPSRRSPTRQFALPQKPPQIVDQEPLSISQRSVIQIPSAAQSTQRMILDQQTPSAQFPKEAPPQPYMDEVISPDQRSLTTPESLSHKHSVQFARSFTPTKQRSLDHHSVSAFYQDIRSKSPEKMTLDQEDDTQDSTVSLSSFPKGAVFTSGRSQGKPPHSRLYQKPHPEHALPVKGTPQKIPYRPHVYPIQKAPKQPQAPSKTEVDISFSFEFNLLSSAQHRDTGQGASHVAPSDKLEGQHHVEPSGHVEEHARPSHVPVLSDGQFPGQHALPQQASPPQRAPEQKSEQPTTHRVETHRIPTVVPLKYQFPQPYTQLYESPRKPPYTPPTSPTHLITEMPMRRLAQPQFISHPHPPSRTHQQLQPQPRQSPPPSHPSEQPKLPPQPPLQPLPPPQLPSQSRDSPQQHLPRQPHMPQLPSRSPPPPSAKPYVPISPTPQTPSTSTPGRSIEEEPSTKFQRKLGPLKDDQTFSASGYIQQSSPLIDAVPAPQTTPKAPTTKCRLIQNLDGTWQLAEKEPKDRGSFNLADYRRHRVDMMTVPPADITLPQLIEGLDYIFQDDRSRDPPQQRPPPQPKQAKISTAPPAVTSVPLTKLPFRPADDLSGPPSLLQGKALVDAQKRGDKVLEPLPVKESVSFTPKEVSASMIPMTSLCPVSSLALRDSGEISRRPMQFLNLKFTGVEALTRHSLQQPMTKWVPVNSKGVIVSVNKAGIPVSASGLETQFCWLPMETRFSKVGTRVNISWVPTSYLKRPETSREKIKYLKTILKQKSKMGVGYAMEQLIENEIVNWSRDMDVNDINPVTVEEKVVKIQELIEKRGSLDLSDECKMKLECQMVSLMRHTTQATGEVIPFETRRALVHEVYHDQENLQLSRRSQAMVEVIRDTLNLDPKTEPHDILTEKVKHLKDIIDETTSDMGQEDIAKVRTRLMDFVKRSVEDARAEHLDNLITADINDIIGHDIATRIQSAEKIHILQRETMNVIRYLMIATKRPVMERIKKMQVTVDQAKKRMTDEAAMNLMRVEDECRNEIEKMYVGKDENFLEERLAVLERSISAKFSRRYVKIKNIGKWDVELREMEILASRVGLSGCLISKQIRQRKRGVVHEPISLSAIPAPIARIARRPFLPKSHLPELKGTMIHPAKKLEKVKCSHGEQHMADLDKNPEMVITPRMLQMDVQHRLRMAHRLFEQKYPSHL